MLLKLQIRFVSYQYNRWMRATDKLKRMAEYEQEDLPRRMSIDYVDMIRKNLLSGKYSSTYMSYNPRYEEWKTQVFKSSGGFWELRGELLTSLKSLKHSKGWFGGIPAGVMDSGNVSWFGTGNKGRPVPIAQYAHWMEYGRRGQPSRPLFGPTLIEYSEGKGVTRIDEAKNKLKGQWR